MLRSLNVYPHKNGEDGGPAAEAFRRQIKQQTGRPAYTLVCREDCAAVVSPSDLEVLRRYLPVEEQS